MQLNGRTKIVAPYNFIDKTNVVDVLKNALQIHLVNKAQIDYLFNYHRGIQPILQREKKIRPEINNKIVVNYARLITSFKTGYLLFKPIQFVARKDKTNDKNITTLNDFGLIDNKKIKDKEVANFQSKCGTAYKYIVPNVRFENDGNSAPYITKVIDPRMAFAIYTSEVGGEQIGGVVIDWHKNSNGEIVWRLQCYTEDRLYVVESDVWQIEEYANPLGIIPVIEYPLNEERMGDFEPVIDVLNAINNVESNRVDGVEQFIQSLLVFKNVDIESESFKTLQEQGAIKIKDSADGEKKVEANVFYLNQELKQSEVQKLKENLFQCVREIVGMPTQGNGSSISANNGAMEMSSGWYMAEARATDTETFFEGSERRVLKVILKICNILTLGNFNLALNEIDIKFTRRNYENLLTKAQTLTTMLSTKQIAPRVCFQVCGLFPDPEQAYIESEEYIKSNTLTAEKVAEIAVKQQGDNENVES